MTVNGSRVAASPRAERRPGVALRGPIAVVVSRFPLITETFVLREIEELERQGQPVVLVPLIRERGGVSHPEAQPWLGRIVYVPFLSPAVIAANLRTLCRHPARYAGALAEAVAGSAHSLNVLIRTIAFFPKTVCLAGRLADLGIRHLHAHFATYPAGAALTVSRLSGITYSFTAHAHDVFVPWRRASLRRKIARARFVRAIAEHGRRTLLEFCGPAERAKVEVIHVGVRPEDYELAAPPPAAIPTMLCVAALKPYKGLAVLLDACQQLRREGRRFRCEIVGDGPLRPAIEDLRASMNLDDTVTLRGPLPQHEVTKLLARAHVAVAPSIVAPDGQMDGIPVALMEAMAAGRPVVASRLSGVPELVEDGETGLLVEPGNSGELAAAIGRLLDDAALGARMGERGRRKIEREFRLDRCVGALLRTLDAHNPAPGSFDRCWRDAIDELLPGRAVGIRRVHLRPDSTVLQLVVRNGRNAHDLVLKIHTARDGNQRLAAARAEHEARVLGHLQAMAAPSPAGSAEFAYTVPQVLGTTGAALLLEACDGTPLVDLARTARLGGAARRGALLDAVRHTGRWLRRFHEQTSMLSGAPQTLQAIVERAYRDVDRCVAAPLFSDAEHAAVLQRLGHLAERAAASCRPGTRTSGHHGDFWPGNIFVADRRVTAIDFEGFRQGLPQEDVAYFLVQLELFFTYTPFRRLREALRNAFLEAYCDGEPIDEAAYAFCRFAKVLQILANGARSGPPERGTARRLRALREMAVRG